MSPGNLVGRLSLSIPQVTAGRESDGDGGAELAVRDWHLVVSRVVISLAFALTLLFGVLDLNSPETHAHGLLCVPSRVARTALIAGLAVFTWRRGLERIDTGLIGAAMLVALVGDIYLVRHREIMVGMGCFAAVQILLSTRHIRSILRIKHTTVPWWPIALAFTGSGVVWAMVLSLIASTPYFVSFTLFLALLTLSLGVAWGQVIRGGWQSPNDLEAALGMSLFYMCDVAFGVFSALSFLHAEGVGLARLAVDLCYTPALVLLVLSAHNWPIGFSRWLVRDRFANADQAA